MKDEVLMQLTHIIIYFVFASMEDYFRQTEIILSLKAKNYFPTLKDS